MKRTHVLLICALAVGLLAPATTLAAPSSRQLLVQGYVNTFFYDVQCPFREPATFLVQVVDDRVVSFDGEVTRASDGMPHATVHGDDGWATLAYACEGATHVITDWWVTLDLLCVPYAVDASRFSFTVAQPENPTKNHYHLEEAVATCV